MIIYVGSPISGKTLAGVKAYYQKVEKDLQKMKFTVLIPNLIDNNGTYYKNNTEKCRKAYRDDQELIKRADMVMIDLTMAFIASVGCIREMAWAKQYHKTLLAILPSKIEWCNHSFLIEDADIIMDTYEEAMRFLSLIKRRNCDKR